MPTFVSDRRIYLNADKTAVVEEGSPEATHLLVAKNGELSQEDAERWGLDLSEQPKPPTTLERERAGLEQAEKDPGRSEEARFRRQRIADLEAEEAAQAKRRANAPSTKQVKAAPEDKSR